MKAGFRRARSPPPGRSREGSVWKRSPADTRGSTHPPSLARALRTTLFPYVLASCAFTTKTSSGTWRGGGHATEKEGEDQRGDRLCLSMHLFSCVKRALPCVWCHHTMSAATSGFVASISPGRGGWYISHDDRLRAFLARERVIPYSSCRGVTLERI